MKKTIVLLLLTFCAAWPTYAVTDPKTIDFLKTVSDQYYCLSQMGLKIFTADVSLTTIAESEAELKEPLATYISELNKLVFNVSVQSDGTVAVTFTPPSSFNLDNDVDNRAIQFGNDMAKKLESYLKHWARYTVKPLFDDYKDTETFTTQSNPDGFTVTKQFKDGSITFNFDHQSKLLNSVEWSADNSFLVKDDFSKTDKGYVLNQMQRTFRSSQIATKYEYQPVGTYQLLKRLLAQRYRGDNAMNGIYYYLTFSNYKINQ
jgi:hypothetical protein